MWDKYKSYSRIHKYQNPSDIERGKIQKETTNYIKFNKKSKELSKKIANCFVNDSIDLLDEYEDVIVTSEKE